MLLKSFQTNNGYRCSCCSNGYSDYDWIKEEDALTFEQLLDKAYDFENNLDGLVELRYEKDGKTLYGYETIFDKRMVEVSIIIDNKSYRIVADGTDSKIFSKEYILDVWRYR